MADQSRRTLPAAVIVVAVLSWLSMGFVTATRQGDIAWVAGFVVYAAAWFGARHLIRNIAERPAAQVDEYEFAQRQEARNVGYVAALAGALLLYVAFSFAARVAPQLLLHANEYVFLVFLLAAALPSFVLCWRARRTE